MILPIWRVFSRIFLCPRQSIRNDVVRLVVMISSMSWPVKLSAHTHTGLSAFPRSLALSIDLLQQELVEGLLPCLGGLRRLQYDADDDVAQRCQTKCR